MYNLYEQEKSYHTTLMVLVLVDSFPFLFKHSRELVLQIFNPYKIDMHALNTISNKIITK